MNKNAGFTLIELLVVVLIIGILAAIALPQYTLSVEKSRAMQAVVFLKAWKDAEEIYYMGNGTYTADWESLGLSVPNEITRDYSFDATNEIPTGRFGLYRDKYNYGLIYSAAHRTSSADYIPQELLQNALYCFAFTTEGQRVCATLAGKKLNNTFWRI